MVVLTFVPRNSRYVDDTQKMKSFGQTFALQEEKINEVTEALRAQRIPDASTSSALGNIVSGLLTPKPAKRMAASSVLRVLGKLNLRSTSKF